MDMKEIENINLYRETYIDFFTKESVRQKVKSSVYEFAVRYNAMRIKLSEYCTSIDVEKNQNIFQNSIKFTDNMAYIDSDSEFGKRKLKRFEIPEIVFFGIGDKISPTHQFIKDNKCFWGLFCNLFSYVEFPSFLTEEIRNACTLNNRLNFPLEERNRAGLIFDTVSIYFNDLLNAELNENHSASIEEILEIVKQKMIKGVILKNGKQITLQNLIVTEACKESEKVSNTMRKLFKSEDSTTVFRGFDIAFSESVRKSRFKKNNEFARHQESGKGISYTCAPNVAKKFALSKHQNCLSLSNNERVKNKSHFKFDLLGIDPDNFLEAANRLPVIAKFRLNKKDILFTYIGSTFSTQESEISCLPNNVELLDYRLLNPKFDFAEESEQIA
jgi:hypothetical protein